jgi:hypothetical protein
MFGQFQMPQMSRYLPSIQACATLQVVKNYKKISQHKKVFILQKIILTTYKPCLLKVFFRAKFGYEFIIADEKKNMQYAMYLHLLPCFFCYHWQNFLSAYVNLFFLLSYHRCTTLCFNIS